MANRLLKLGLPVALAALLYQIFFKNLIFVFLGLGRQIQVLDDFPYSCRRIEDSRLTACEDMFLSDATRQLFLACSDPVARTKWMPNIARFNVTARSLSDAVIALDIDSPTLSNGQNSFNYRVLKQVNYPQNAYDDENLHLVGLTGIDSPNAIELLLVNAKPSRDPSTGNLLDQENFGANSTVERFVTGPQATTMKHVATYSHSQITTPNNIATAPGMKGFYITNDHGPHKTGIMHRLSEVLLKRGDVTYCDTSTQGSLHCSRLVSGINFPNGLLFHPEQNLLYVPSAVNGNIHVYRPSYAPGSTVPSLKKVFEIHVPYPIDNLSLDPYTGDIYFPGFPNGPAMMAGFEDPNLQPPITGLKLTMLSDDSAGGKFEYRVEKAIEDIGGKDGRLPGATTVIKDGKTGRLFLSALASALVIFGIGMHLLPMG